MSKLLVALLGTETPSYSPTIVQETQEVKWLEKSHTICLMGGLHNFSAYKCHHMASLVAQQ